MTHPPRLTVQICSLRPPLAAAGGTASRLWYRVPWEAAVISKYVAEALHRARYQLVDGDVYCATVAGLPGVISTGPTLESCRDQLAEVIEEWLLVRVAHRLPIPRLGTVGVQVKKAS